MPALVATPLGEGGVRASTRVTLGATGNTFTYSRGAILILHNPTGGALTPVIDGDAGTTAFAKGFGTITVSAGLSLGAIAAGAQVLVPLDDIEQYLRGTIDITSGTGLVATLLTI
jgi:hypothetical protein